MAYILFLLQKPLDYKYRYFRRVPVPEADQSFHVGLQLCSSGHQRFNKLIWIHHSCHVTYKQVNVIQILELHNKCVLHVRLRKPSHSFQVPPELTLHCKTALRYRVLRAPIDALKSVVLTQRTLSVVVSAAGSSWSCSSVFWVGVTCPENDSLFYGSVILSGIQKPKQQLQTKKLAERR